MGDLYSHTDIDTLAYELALEAPATGQNKQLRSLTIVKAVEQRSIDAGDDSAVVDLLKSVLGVAKGWHWDKAEVSGLLASLEVDGFEYADGKLIPTSPTPVRLAPEVSALEHHLEAITLTTALTHYRQATDNLTRGQFEAANGQVRSFLENLVIELCQKVTTKSVSDASAALQHLRSRSAIDEGEFKVCKGFWDATHTNGAHQGMSNEDEAQFRLHVGTALGRYLLRKLAPLPAA